MAKPKDPSDFFAALLEAFRAEPGNVLKASKAAGVSWPTAQRAWEKGSKKHGYGPIKDTIAQEQLKARSLIEAERLAARAARDAEIKQSADQAVTARKQEGQMTGLVRGASLVALTAVTQLAKESRQLAEAMSKQIAIERTKLEQWTLYEAALVAGDQNAPQLKPAWATAGNSTWAPSVSSLLNILNRSADYAQKISACARQAMEMERLHLGEPLGTIALSFVPQEMSLEEVEIRKANALEAIASARRVGGLKVIDGGRTEPVVGTRVVVR